MIRWQLEFALNTFKKRKGRAILALLAISISVGTIVASNGAVDNLGKNFVQTTFTDLPNSDIIIAKSNNKLIDNLSPIKNSLTNTDVKGISPRIQKDGSIYYLNSKNEEILSPVTVIGINFTQEDSLGLGRFFPDITNLPINECLVIGSLGEQVQSTTENSLTLRLYLSSAVTVNTSIIKSQRVSQIKKFSNTDRNIIVVDIETLYQFIPSGSATQVIGIFNDHNSLYSVRNIENTIKEVRQRATLIQDRLGYDYVIQVPIAQALTNVQSSLAGSQILLNLVSFLMVLLSIIIIYSLTSSSIEERIYEYGIFRAIGIDNKSVYFQTFLQSLILALIGSVTGILFGLLLLISLLPTFSLQNTNLLSFIFFIANALIAGIGTTLIASIVPAFQSTKKQILNALDVSRMESSEYQKRITSYRTTLLSWNKVKWGIFISIPGILMIVIYPALEYLFSQETVNSFFFILVTIQFFGFILLCMGLFGPALEGLVTKLFSFVSKEYAFVVNLFLRKNRRRNLSTMLIYGLAFSFIFFLTINQGMYYETQIFDLKKTTGSDYQIYSTDQQSNFLLNNETLNFSKNYPNIQSSFITIPGLQSIIGCDIKIGDKIGFKTYFPAVYGTEGSLLKSLFDTYELSPNSNFAGIDGNNTVVISGSLAKALDININDFLRITISSSIQSVNQHFGKDYNLKVVGVAFQIPGFPDVSNDESLVSHSAIFVGEKTWTTMITDKMNLNDQNLPKMVDFISKIFSKRTITGSTNYTNNLFLQFGSKVGLVDYEKELTNFEEMLISSTNGIALILSISIILTLFAVFGSTTATIIESQKDIGLLKALGLNDTNITKIFILESLIIGFVSALMGSMTGYIVEYMVAFNTAVYNNLPLIIIYPPIMLIVTYLLALVFAYLGSKIPAKKISKLNVSEIFR